MAKKYTGWAYVSGSTGEGADGPVGAVQYRKDGASTDQTGSVNFVFSEGAAALFLTGTMHVDGTITSNNFDVVNHTVSYLSASGDSKFGDTAGDTHQFTGSVEVLGQISSSAEVSASAFWGDGANLSNLPASGAPTTAQYITLATDGTLANERVLTPGANIGFTDAGAGGALTIVSSASAAGVFTQFNATQGYTTSSVAIGINRAPLGRLHLETNNATTCIFFEREHSSISLHDELGCLAFGGTLNGGTNYAPNAAVIRSVADGGWSNISTDTPAKLQFMTTPDGSNTVYTRMTIKGDGKVGIGDLDPSGTLHVQSARAVVSPHASADDLIVETAGTPGGISVLNDDSNQNSIFMGHTSDNLTSHWTDSYATKIASFGSDNIYYRTAIASANNANALVLDHSQNTHVLGNLTVTGSLVVKDQARHLIYSTPGTGNFTSTAAAVNIFADGSWTTPPTYASGNITANDIVFDQTTGRFTTSQPPRLYSVTCSITTLSTHTNAMINLTATVNGSTVFKLGDHSAHNSVDPVNLVMTFLVEMDASEYLEIWVDQTASTYHSDVQWLSLCIHAI